MRLGKYWLRFLIIIVVLILFRQLVKTWTGILEDVPVNSQINENDEENVDVVKAKDVQKVVVAVYYEALCPDSRGFVIRQVEPTYQKLPDNVIIQMIPYGKATTTELPNGYKFTCQHGPRECEANMIHACAIDIIKNPAVQLNFLTCMIEHNLWPVNITRTCAEKYHLDAELILNCSKTNRGPELLAQYGKMTHALKPPITFIPTITLDGDSDDQSSILINLLQEVCKKFKVLPNGCKTLRVDQS
ncbi:gamma-interferon-inducible lysosomal thiol reductase-like protein [Cotesia typhae]|uniref:gamma-interferon-inducible lysosomal thiol reductase-like protein n=1 Tax=Cotesia typhae TaxID=2053667 RepID=UPI003D6804B8